MTTGFVPAPGRPWIYKDPDAKLGYGVDWTDWLEGADAIALATWSISPSGALTFNPGKTALDGSKAVVFLEGGEVGATYTVTCHVVTNSGDEDDRSFDVRIKQR